MGQLSCRPALHWSHGEVAFASANVVKAESVGALVSAAYEESERDRVIPFQALPQIGDREYRKYQKSNHLLHGLELGRRIDPVADMVGRHRQAIFKKGDAPAGRDQQP